MILSIPLPSPAEGFIPQQGAMRFIDQLLHAESNSGMAQAVISDGHLLLNDEGTLDAVAFPELVAQTYAAVIGYRLRQAGLPLQKGYLVSVQKCQTQDTAKQGDRLIISIETNGTFGGFIIVSGKVCRDDQLIATAKIKLYIPSMAEEYHDA